MQGHFRYNEQLTVNYSPTGVEAAVLRRLSPRVPSLSMSVQAEVHVQAWTSDQYRPIKIGPLMN